MPTPARGPQKIRRTKAPRTAITPSLPLRRGATLRRTLAPCRAELSRLLDCRPPSSHGAQLSSSCADESTPSLVHVLYDLMAGPLANASDTAQCSIALSDPRQPRCRGHRGPKGAPLASSAAVHYSSPRAPFSGSSSACFRHAAAKYHAVPLWDTMPCRSGMPCRCAIPCRSGIPSRNGMPRIPRKCGLTCRLGYHAAVRYRAAVRYHAAVARGYRAAVGPIVPPWVPCRCGMPCRCGIPCRSKILCRCRMPCHCGMPCRCTGQDLTGSMHKEQGSART
jgi:hypothetical protein